MNTQAAIALANANEVRLERADILKRIRQGELDPVSVLDQSPGIPVMEFLLALPRVGKTRAIKVLESLGLGENLKLGWSAGRTDLRDATVRERRVLAEWVTGYMEGRGI